MDELPQLSPKPEFEKTSPTFLTSTSGKMSASSPSNRDRGLSPLAESEEDSVDGTASEGDREEKGERKREEENSSRKANGNANANSAHTSVADLAWKEKERIARLTMRQREREESDEPIPVGGCGEAVEILTRNPKKGAYPQNLRMIKVTFLISPIPSSLIRCEQRRCQSSSIDLYQVCISSWGDYPRRG